MFRLTVLLTTAVVLSISALNVAAADCRPVYEYSQRSVIRSFADSDTGQSVYDAPAPAEEVTVWLCECQPPFYVDWETGQAYGLWCDFTIKQGEWPPDEIYRDTGCLVTELGCSLATGADHCHPGTSGYIH